MNALVLSGGGARGYFEWQVVRQLMEAGMKWDLIAGVSSGAMVGSIAAVVQGGYHSTTSIDQLFERLERKDIISGGLSFGRALRLMGIRGRRFSIYDTDPLRRLLEAWINPMWFELEGTPRVLVGVTLLQQRTYLAAELGLMAPDERLPLIRASGSIPVMFEPVKKGMPGISWGVDGGVRNMSPLKDVLAAEPDHITVVNASNPFAKVEDAEDPESIVDVIEETLFHLTNEVFRGDYKQLLDRNEEAKNFEGATDEPHPRWKVYDATVIEPTVTHWPKTLDFSLSAKRLMKSEATRLVRQAVATGTLPL